MHISIKHTEICRRKRRNNACKDEAGTHLVPGWGCSHKIQTVPILHLTSTSAGCCCFCHHRCWHFHWLVWPAQLVGSQCVVPWSKKLCHTEYSMICTRLWSNLALRFASLTVAITAYSMHQDYKLDCASLHLTRYSCSVSRQAGE